LVDFIKFISGRFFLFGHFYNTHLHLKVHDEGHLAGSVSRACDSWSWGHEFEPHTGCSDFLKKVWKYMSISIMTCIQSESM